MAMNWTKEQQEVIDSRDCSLLVSAAAGSGKTAVLTARILSLITDPEHPLDIDRLLVVTFTNAAASEMRERIRRNLESELEADPQNLHLQRQVSLIHNACIMTIDGFCLQVVRSHFFLTDLDPGFRIADPGELDLLRADVCDAVLNQFYEREDPVFLTFAENYSGAKNDDRLAEMILQLYDYSQSYPWPGEWLSSCADSYRIPAGESLDTQAWCRILTGFFSSSTEDMEQQLMHLLDLAASPEGPYMYQEALESDLLQIRKLTRCASLSEWQQALSSLSFQKLKPARKFEGNDALKEYVKEKRNVLKKELQSWQEKIFPVELSAAEEKIRQTAPMAQELAALTDAFSRRYAIEKKKRNILDFSDCEHMALQILVDPETKKPTPAAGEYRRQFAGVMVDEYQDSNFVQEAILQAVSGIPEGKENYFTVGDVKQSIYRFRLARPELFMEKYTSYKDDGSVRKKIDLRQNFRSRPEVIDFVNGIFYKTMKADIGNITYDADAALYAGGDFSGDPSGNYAPEILLCPDQGGALSARRREAEMAAQRIRKLINKQEIPGLRFSDIVILMRSPSRCADIWQEVLSAYGIPVHVQSQTGYFSAMEVRLVLEMLKVIDNPLQDIPLAAVMHSFFGKFTADEMAQIRAAYPDIPFAEAVISFGKEKEGLLAVKVREFLSMISEFREMVPYTPIHLLLEELLRRTGFYYYAAALPSGRQRRANLDMLVQRAVDYEKTSYRGLLHFNRYIELLKKYDVDYGEADVISEADDAVRLMSIHKSKGLEFPVVFLSDTGGSFNTADEKNNIIFHPDYGFGLRYVSKETHVKADTLIRQAFSMDTRRENLGEELRVLYVALTRAEKKLILTGNCGQKKLSALQETEAGPLDFFSRYHAGCYLDYLLPAAAGDSSCRIQYLTEEELETGRSVLEEERFRSELRQRGNTYDSDSRYDTALDALFSWKYPYEDEVMLQQKISVSELKQRAMEQNQKALTDTDEVRMFREEVPAPYVPQFALAEAAAKPGGAVYGTAMHQFLRYVDYLALPEERNTRSIRSYIRTQKQKMLENGMLDAVSAEQLSLTSLKRFLCSDIAERIASAASRGELYREQPFMMAVDAKRIRSDAPDEATVLVQGIIDIFWKEADGIVLMDYKTDHLESAADLLERYHVQLELYREALTLFYPDTAVKEVCIYSLYLDQVVPLA